MYRKITEAGAGIYSAVETGNHSKNGQYLRSRKDSIKSNLSSVNFCRKCVILLFLSLFVFINNITAQSQSMIDRANRESQRAVDVIQSKVRSGSSSSSGSSSGGGYSGSGNSSGGSYSGSDNSSGGSSSSYYDSQQRQKELREAEAKMREQIRTKSLNTYTNRLKGTKKNPAQTVFSREDKLKAEEIAKELKEFTKRQVTNEDAASNFMRKKIASFTETTFLRSLNISDEWKKEISRRVAEKIVRKDNLEKRFIPNSLRYTHTLLKAGVDPQAIDNAKWVAHNVTELCDKITENILQYVYGEISLEQYMENVNKLQSNFNQAVQEQWIEILKSKIVTPVKSK
jgi:hypothetical protein